MNKPQPKIDAELGTAGTDEASVADFLSRHTDFFERHPALLAQLKIPHARGDSSTISLVERQVDLLRERGREVELKLATLIDNGRTNDGLATKIHGLAKRLIQSRSPQQRLAAIEASLREDFGVQEFVIALSAPADDLTATRVRQLRVIDAHDAAWQSLDSLFEMGKPRCGRIRDSQRDMLFPALAASTINKSAIPRTQ